MCNPHKATCLNCGKAIESARPAGTVIHCSIPCKREFNNRRMTRGAEIYDLMMAVRYERETATEQALWSKACALLAHYRSEDERERDSRRSWQNHRAVTERRPAIFAGVASGQRDKARRGRADKARAKACAARDAAVRASNPI